MTTFHNSAAFPLFINSEETESGLTKREYFATQILQGLTAKYTLKTPEDQIVISKMAIELADTFINELNK